MNLNSSKYVEEIQLLQVDRYLPEKVRTYIEENYYAKVNQQAELDYAARNEDFIANPLQHVALYSDHGVVHVRDVARNILVVLEAIHGVLIPQREPLWFDFMKGYGIIIVYNHDMGMLDFSAFGRAMHPEFVTQEVFSPAFDQVIDTIWTENCGNVSWRLINLADQGALTEDPKLVLREMVSMGVAHSKSKVPIEVLNNPQQLRQVMRQIATVNLHHLYHQQQVTKAENKLAQAKNSLQEHLKIEKLEIALLQVKSTQAEFLKQGTSPRNERIDQYYSDFEKQAFSWLVCDHPETQALIVDVSDTIRALRAADALRQRGTVYKTSGGYQIFVDQNTAKAIYALQKGSGELFLLEAANPLNAGEANIASSELTANGDLRISFNRGSFSNQDAAQRAAYNLAVVIDDIQRDIIDTFSRPANANDVIKKSENIEILLENTDDNLDFAEAVQTELGKIASEIGLKSRVVPSLKNIDPEERDRYLIAKELDWSLEQKQKILLRVSQSGHKIQNIDPLKAFTDVYLSVLKEGETLIKAGSPPGFVYIPMGIGLVSNPLGGYQPQGVKPWIPLGNIRVIRGDQQEATITAEQQLELLIIPKEIYLKYWHNTYNAEEFSQQILRIYAEDNLQELEQIFNILRQVALIDKTLDDTEVDFIQQLLESYRINYSTEEVREKLLTGEDSDFVSLRQSVLDYLSLDPPYFQVGRLRDLLNLLVKVDEEISAEESLILSELNNLLDSYLADETIPKQFKVLIIPTTSEQNQGIRTIFPTAPKVENPWGKAYLCGSFYSKEYANMILQRYRNLNFYAILEEDEYSV
ncbi:hypothetical protein [Anabaena sp. UHCC 0399]|uniref:hypothetical protein n=1 Tax=Anabaena sp. UHCC 0399 TaxID=3110238 RepID=UPI002B1F0109|nr:hypothetical protein [Anabaena sp. UHCC 0399]MEA5565365.1 hypothetical protein [Anabaena sp. UHCC 0399]